MSLILKNLNPDNKQEERVAFVANVEIRVNFNLRP